MHTVNGVVALLQVSVNPRVTACDIAHVPLPDACVSVGVFSLALMGTNWIEFIQVLHSF